MIDDDIRAALAAKADALVQRAADRLAALIHDDFVYVNAGGRRFDKAGYVEAYCTSGSVVFREQRVDDLEVRSFDGFAVATLRVSDRFSAGGQDIAATYRSLCVFTRVDGRWHWAAGQTMATAAT
jgi:ketosteroid isomerase-like protein